VLPKVVWLKPVRGTNRNTVQRIEAIVIGVKDEYCTMELVNGERRTAKVEDKKLVKTANA
jgi:hypothetical protein